MRWLIVFPKIRRIGTWSTMRYTHISLDDQANRDFPYGLGLEPIQTRNLRDYNTTTSPSQMCVDSSTFFPSSSPSDPGTGPIGAFSSGQRVFCADHLHEELRFPLFDPLQLHVTCPAAAELPAVQSDQESRRTISVAQPLRPVGTSRTWRGVSPSPRS
jgi:hypothetical protein